MDWRLLTVIFVMKEEVFVEFSIFVDKILKLKTMFFYDGLSQKILFIIILWAMWLKV